MDAQISPQELTTVHILASLPSLYNTNLTIKPNTPITAPVPAPPWNPSAPPLLVEDVTDAGVASAVVLVAEIVAALPVLGVDRIVDEDGTVPLERLVEVPVALGVAVAPTRSVVTVPSGAVYSPVL